MEHPLVCITLRGETAEQISRDAQEAKELGADMVEVRIDKLWLREERIPIDSNQENQIEGDGFQIIQNSLDFGEVDFKSDLAEISQSTDSPICLLYTSDAADDS